MNFEHGAIKHCPRCGCRGRIIQGDTNQMFSVLCDNGCMESPQMDTKREAVQWWNVRPKRRLRRSALQPE